MNNKHIIIIGGMGPQASLELHRRLISRAAEGGACECSDFPRITHLSLPIDDFISDENNAVKAVDMIAAAMEHFYLWREQTSNRVQYCTLTCA